METKMNQEFNWVIKVLSSSKTIFQIQTSEKLFINFKEKWYELIDGGVNEIIFNKKFKDKKEEIKKLCGFDIINLNFFNN